MLLPWITSSDALFRWSGPWDFRWPLDLRQLRRDLNAGLVVRRARFADAPVLARLLTDLGYPQAADQTRAQLANWVGDPRGTVLVAESDGSPDGLIAAHAVPYLERPGAFARVVALAVDPEQRRYGVGAGCWPRWRLGRMTSGAATSRSRLRALARTRAPSTRPPGSLTCATAPPGSSAHSVSGWLP